MTRNVKATKEQETDAKILETATANLNEGSKAARSLFGALTLSGRKTLEGVLAFDKAVFGIVKNNVTSAIDHTKATMSAKSINDVVELQAAYAHSYIEATAANSRELLDLAKTRTEEAYAPVKVALSELKGDKKAA